MTPFVRVDPSIARASRRRSLFWNGGERRRVFRDFAELEVAPQIRARPAPRRVSFPFAAHRLQI